MRKSVKSIILGTLCAAAALSAASDANAQVIVRRGVIARPHPVARVVTAPGRIVRGTVAVATPGVRLAPRPAVIVPRVVAGPRMIAPYPVRPYGAVGIGAGYGSGVSVGLPGVHAGVNIRGGLGFRF